MRLVGLVTCFLLICSQQFLNAAPTDLKISTKTVVSDSNRLFLLFALCNIKFV